MNAPQDNHAGTVNRSLELIENDQGSTAQQLMAARILATEVRSLREELAIAQGALKMASGAGFIGLAEAERLREVARDLLAWHDNGHVVLLQDHADKLRRLLDGEA